MASKFSPMAPFQVLGDGAQGSAHGFQGKKYPGLTEIPLPQTSFRLPLTWPGITRGPPAADPGDPEASVLV